jgi:gliding motility-associated-like protein
VNIRLEAASAYGCTETFSRNVRILPRPVADFFIANPIIQFPLNTFSFVNQNVQAGFTYLWDFGDGNTSTAANPGTHTYSSPDTFVVRLIVSNAQCSDTLERLAIIQPPIPVVQFQASAEGCAPLIVSFKNNTLYATEYSWDFGDGNTSNEFEPTHIYRLGGTYTVRLIARGLGGQDVDVKVDSIVVRDLPNAFFIAQPRTVIIPSDPVVVFNLSNNAIQFFWDFGDGFTSTEPSPEHYYTTPGDFTIRLIARNEFGCLDTFSVTNAVRAEGGGRVVVPNAFTPNPNGSGGGFIVPGEFNNDVFHPVVNGADTYQLKIYNRWGELIFESNDVNIGWDGYYRGELCKQDVYVWKVELGYSDGRKETKAGDLVLLR